jgi:hypothetical protein
MTNNTPRNPGQNQNPNDRRDKTNIKDPAKERDNDGGRRQQEAQQPRPQQQNDRPQQRPQDQDNKRKPQQQS